MEAMGWVVLGALALLVYLIIRLGAAAGSWLTGARFRPYRHLAA